MKLELLTSKRTVVKKPDAVQPVVEAELDTFADADASEGSEEEEACSTTMSANGRQRMKRELRMLKKSNPSLYEKITQFR